MLEVKRGGFQTSDLSDPTSGSFRHSLRGTRFQSVQKRVERQYAKTACAGLVCLVLYGILRRAVSRGYTSRPQVPQQGRAAERRGATQKALSRACGTRRKRHNSRSQVVVRPHSASGITLGPRRHDREVSPTSRRRRRQGSRAKVRCGSGIAGNIDNYSSRAPASTGSTRTPKSLS